MLLSLLQLVRVLEVKFMVVGLNGLLIRVQVELLLLHLVVVVLLVHLLLYVLGHILGMEQEQVILNKELVLQL